MTDSHDHDDKNGHDHSHDHGHDHDHDHDHNHDNGYLWPGISFALLVIGLALDHFYHGSIFQGYIRFGYYLLAYLPVAWPVIHEAIHALQHKNIFNEFFLMSIATIGAFALGEYPEGVAVMLFYSIGELFQMNAVAKAKDNIKALLDVRPNIAAVLRNNKYETVKPQTVKIGETIQVKMGEKIPLDGTLISNTAMVNTAALTGESRLQQKLSGESLLAGSINMDQLIQLKVTKLFENSSIARILDLVQNASARKSKTELLIRRLAKIYTPIVVYLAIAIVILPYLFANPYIFSDWLYRALIFLVISCPCALVISIPLGYFGGLGAASKNGILFKGASFLDQLTKVNTVVMDKTGTLTHGNFKVKDIVVESSISQEKFMDYMVAVEQKSNHPIAKAILTFSTNPSDLEVEQLEEIPGKGIQAMIHGKSVLVGNQKLMDQFKVTTSEGSKNIVETVVLMAIDQEFVGYLSIADEIKSDAASSIQTLKDNGIKDLLILSGDKEDVTQAVAKELGIPAAEGGLLPEDKLNRVLALKNHPKKVSVIAFVGDGINDAPVLAASDIGIAMGGLGSDVAIETADVVIQTDQPSKIPLAIKIAKSTQRIIWQNITIAFGVKFIVLILGALGLATMWAAVFADVGVALLAILNAVRLQHMKF